MNRDCPGLFHKLQVGCWGLPIVAQIHHCTERQTILEGLVVAITAMRVPILCSA